MSEILLIFGGFGYRDDFRTCLCGMHGRENDARLEVARDARRGVGRRELRRELLDLCALEV